MPRSTSGLQRGCLPTLTVDGPRSAAQRLDRPSPGATDADATRLGLLSATSLRPSLRLPVWARDIFRQFASLKMKYKAANGDLVCFRMVVLEITSSLYWSASCPQYIAGGVMRYMKSGSQKSLATGGISALALYFLHTQLPVRPVFVSSIGSGMQKYPISLLGLIICIVVITFPVIIPKFDSYFTLADPLFMLQDISWEIIFVFGP